MNTESMPNSKDLAHTVSVPSLQKMASAIRILAMDAVQQANSGHPGMPMGMADIAVALWAPCFGHLKHNPKNPSWPNRDRFVVSNGHGSMLLYALLHLTGYDLPMSEIKKFRQLHSKTPGHPEYLVTPGVETTTGPLGQGLANAVGMCLAEKMLAAEFNRPGFPIVNHKTWVFAGDGCLMEGISHEVCSLAGVLHLSKLILIYDDNRISIDGKVDHWFSDDTAKRFSAYGWHVIEDVDGHDIHAVSRALACASDWSEKSRSGVWAPTIVICRTEIGKGSPNRCNTSKAHGEPLGEEEIAASRALLDWSFEPFFVPEDVYSDWNAQEAGYKAEESWEMLRLDYARRYPEEFRELTRRLEGRLPDDFQQYSETMLSEVFEKSESIATRQASQRVLDKLGNFLPELLGGSADLTSSNLTAFSGAGQLRCVGLGKEFNGGRHINFGVREFGMFAALTGVALHGGFIPYGGTFLVFSDYARNAMRMAALMRQRAIFVLTHDSIALGEDGPTHQPIEHLAALRLIPFLTVWRPCDAFETGVAWNAAIMKKSGPSALILSRQTLPFLTSSEKRAGDISRGGYVIYEDNRAKLSIVATGSEVSLALAARDLLEKEGLYTRVISMPATDVFDQQDEEYRKKVLLPNIPSIVVEAGVTGGWWRYCCKAVVGVDRFGESAPAKVLLEYFGFTPQNVARIVREVIEATSS